MFKWESRMARPALMIMLGVMALLVLVRLLGSTGLITVEDAIAEVQDANTVRVKFDVAKKVARRVDADALHRSLDNKPNPSEPEAYVALGKVAIGDSSFAPVVRRYVDAESETNAKTFARRALDHFTGISAE